jgi:uncharacterized protein YerC
LLLEGVDVKTIEIAGRKFVCTLSDRFRRHSDDEREVMRESVRRFGVLNLVRLYHDEELDDPNCVLDGEGRLEIAAEVGADVDTIHMGRLTREQAYELAKAFNDHRRHEDPETIRRRRLERVAEMRADGKSIRTIADEEGVSKTQVERDLDQLSRGGTVAPEKVVGKDGKTRTATPKKKQPEPVKQVNDATDGEADERTPEPPSGGEEAGEGAGVGGTADPAPEPVHPADEFVARINRLCVRLDECKAEAMDLAKHEYGGHIHGESVEHQIVSARKALWQARPTEVCEPGSGINGTDRTSAARVLRRGGR